MRKWLLVAVGIMMVGIATFLVLSFNFNDEASGSDSSSTKGETMKIGYVIIEENTIYFIPEKDLSAEEIENGKWGDRSSFQGHPADYVLEGKAVDSIANQLVTGDRVEIWYEMVLESYPARIQVTQIEKK